LCDAEIMTPRSARSERVSMATGGRRERPEQEHVHAHRRETGSERRLDHVARQAGVLADHDAVTVVAAREVATGRHAHAQRGLGRHRGIRPCHAISVGSKIFPAHRSLRTSILFPDAASSTVS
jgi:hypothetical protein